MEKFNSFTFTEIKFFDLYGIEDYMTYLIGKCSSDIKQVFPGTLLGSCFQYKPAAGTYVY